jgi:hypothetical protein
MTDATTTQKPATPKPAANEISPFDLVDTHPEHDVVADPDQIQIKLQLDKALKDSFPASDPVSVSQPITAGPTAEASEAMAAEDAMPDEAADENMAEPKAKVPRKNGEPDAE